MLWFTISFTTLRIKSAQRYRVPLCCCLAIILPRFWYVIGISIHIPIPVVAHKAVAEVSQIGHYRRGELL